MMDTDFIFSSFSWDIKHDIWSCLIRVGAKLFSTVGIHCFSKLPHIRDISFKKSMSSFGILQKSVKKLIQYGGQK